ncbi:MAG: HAD family hydrolase [Deltaproteobacteria bacterium]
MNNVLLMWDVDGTLIRSEGLGKRAFEYAFEILTGIKNACSGINLGGKVDIGIYKEMCEAFNVKAVEDEEFIKVYTRALEEIVKDKCTMKINPNIVFLLETLESKKGVYNVLGTGNIEKGARLKLSPVDLNKYFKTGGFGDNETERWRIIKGGIRKSEELFGVKFENENIFVIGDTPRDIECAKKVGVRSIAVATGNFSEAELKESKPDFVFKDLSDTEQVLGSIGI